MRAAVRAGAADEPVGNPDGVLHLAGGVHATVEPLVTLRAGWDAVAVAEGERTFTALVEAFGTGGGWRAVPGIAVLAADGGLVKTAPAVRRELAAYPAFPHRRNLPSPIGIT